MEEAINHDKRFHAFYMKYYRIVVVYALRIIADQVIAEDIVQDAFSNIWERHLHFDTELSARSYLYTTVRNLCLDAQKHESVVLDYKNNAAKTTSITTPDEDYMDKDEVLRRVLEMIDAMPSRQREVFLHIMEGKKAKEIAEMMNISLNTVKMQKRRGIDAMRQKLDPEAFGIMLIILFH